MRRGGPVAEHRSLPVREHGGHPPPLPRQPTVPHGVDAAVDTAEPTYPKPVLDGAPPEPEFMQLRPCDYAVLMRRQLADPPICGPHVELTIHAMVKSSSTIISLPWPPAIATWAARTI